MFEVAELGSRVSKKELEAELPGLRVELVNAQTDLRDADFPVILLVHGDDRTGVNHLVHTLHAWMDARFLPVFTFDEPSDEEAERPVAWRYWRQMPGHGESHVFVGAWVARLLEARLVEGLEDAGWERGLARVARFEEVLASEGALIVKIWLHQSEKAHRKRVKKARKNGEDALVPADLALADGSAYARLAQAATQLIQETSSADAPWEIIESTDPQHRDLAAARAVLAALKRRLEGGAAPAAAAAPEVTPHLPNVLDAVDLEGSVEPDDYHERLDELQRQLREIARDAREGGRSSVVVFEGWDAAGKGGVIRRLTAPMDVRDYRLAPIAAPSDEEKAHHYLWRFWRRLPRAGRILIFDRSWYGRVLVERVEGYASEAEWRRAYAEIVQFEEQLADHDMPVVKFWLHIDPEEQLRRFEAREKTPYKKYKITDDDYRNRGHWDAYEEAVSEMVARTSTDFAPWHLIPANSKRFARVAVLERVCKALRGSS